MLSHVWRWAWVYVLLAGSLAGVVAAAVIRMPQIETLADFTPGLVTRLYDRGGDEFETYAVENRILLEEGKVPELLTHAIVAVEDERFWEHSGIDIQGIARAVVANLKAGEITEGASTLTMQLAENVFHTRGRTWDQKISEALLAVEIEKRYSKPQILTMYANLVYMGEGNYGMEAASRHYFNESVHDLTLPEAATLAGMPQRPNAYNPHRNPELVVQRRNHVLARMRAAKMITEEQYQAAVATPLLVVKKRREEQERIAAYFSEEIRRHLEERYGSKRLYDAGLQVRTTLDPAMQRAAEDAVSRQLLRLDKRKGWRGAPFHLDEATELANETLPSWDSGLEVVAGTWYEGIVVDVAADRADVKIGDEVLPLGREGTSWTRQSDIRRLLRPGDVAWFRLEAAEDEEAAPRLVLEQDPEMESAAIVLESSTGAVRAMVGGWDFARSKFNRATQARRQVGSAFKPFVYGAALESGFTAADTLLDAPVAFQGADARDSYRPRNYQRSYRGIITLRQALERSINVTSVKLLDLVGVDRVIDLARRLGIESELPPYPSLALGSADLVPMELAAAYAAIANHGIHMQPYFVEEVATPEGQVLEENLPQARKSMEPEIAYVLTHMMEGVVDRGTAASMARLDVDLAGKTGTTNEYTDAWFVGFTPRHTILTWVGYDVKRNLGYGMTGTEAALPVWRQIAETGLEEGWIEAGSRFSRPPEVTLIPVEYYTGLRPPPGSEGAVRTVLEAFVTGTEPTRYYDWQWETVMQLPWYQQLPFYIPKEGERMPRAPSELGPEVAEAALD